MEVGYRLTDDVVVGDEGALGAKCPTLSEAYGANCREDLGVVVFWKLVECFKMFDRADQRVSRKKRPDVEKGDRALGAQDHFSR